MPVPNSIDELSPIPADNFPLGSEQVFPNLDNYMRFLASCVAQLRDRANAEGLPMGQVLWWGGVRSAISVRMAALDGQTLNRVDHPELWAFVSSGGYPMVSEADWLATPTKRASFSSGNGSTTFRMPDLNGVQASSIGAVTVRGDGAFSALSPGLLQDSQNLAHAHSASATQDGAHGHSFSGTTSGAGSHSHYDGSDYRVALAGGGWDGWAAGGGANRLTSAVGDHSHSFSGTTAAAGSHTHALTVSSDGGTEARGKSATGAWVIRAK